MKFDELTDTLYEVKFHRLILKGNILWKWQNCTKNLAIAKLFLGTLFSLPYIMRQLSSIESKTFLSYASQEKRQLFAEELQDNSRQN